MLFLNAVQMGFDDESFFLMLISGNGARQYSLSPEHTKRVFLLLEQEIKKFEEKNGKIEAKLPNNKGKTAKEEDFGFRVK